MEFIKLLTAYLRALIMTKDIHDLMKRFVKNKRNLKLLIAFIVASLIVLVLFLLENEIVTTQEIINNIPYILNFALVLIVFLYIHNFIKQHRKLEAKYDALMCLHNEGKVNTINYVLAFDALSKQINEEPKSNSLKVGTAKFTFFIRNQECKRKSCSDCERKSMDGNKCAFDVKYNHYFTLVNEPLDTTIGVDFLILHAYGGLKESECSYYDKPFTVKTAPVPAISKNIIVNHQLTRCRCNPTWNDIPETKKTSFDRTFPLEFRYKINGEHSLMNDIESFVIYPKNFAQSFNRPLTFQLSYAVKPQREIASISIQKLSIERKEKNPARFNVCSASDPIITEGTYTYDFTLDQPVDMDSIYFVIINYEIEEGST